MSDERVIDIKTRKPPVASEEVMATGLGDSILWENRCFKKGIAQGCTDMVPAAWRFSQERLSQFLPAE